jgi:hypothetical protein
LRSTPSLVQRDIGWKDASTAGKGWNVGPQSVGKIRRLPLQDLKRGLEKDVAQKFVLDDPDTGEGHFEPESTKIPALSPESAKGRAIVLVPEALDATNDIEVVVFLHGFTEDTGRPFAGWRALTPPKPPAPGARPRKKSKDEELLERLRQGTTPPTWRRCATWPSIRPSSSSRRAARLSS